MTQVTLRVDGVVVENRVYSKGEVVTVPDERASEMVTAGEAEYAVERGVTQQVSGTNATHPVTDQGFPIDPATGKAHTGAPMNGQGSKLNSPGHSVTNPTAKREDAAVPQTQPGQPGQK